MKWGIFNSEYSLVYHVMKRIITLSFTNIILYDKPKRVIFIFTTSLFPSFQLTSYPFLGCELVFMYSKLMELSTSGYWYQSLIYNVKNLFHIVNKLTKYERTTANVKKLFIEKIIFTNEIFLNRYAVHFCVSER